MIETLEQLEQLELSWFRELVQLRPIGHSRQLDHLRN